MYSYILTLLKVAVWKTIFTGSREIILNTTKDSDWWHKNANIEDSKEMGDIF